GNSIAIRHLGLLITPFGRFGDFHAGQQAALNVWQIRVRAVHPRRFVVATAGGEQGTQGHQPEEIGFSHRTPPSRRLNRPSHTAARARIVTSAESTRAPGMIAQASRACISALKKPRIQAASSMTKYISAGP